MGENNGNILKSINEIIDKKDPTQRILGLLASMVDTNLSTFSKENSDQHIEILGKVAELKDGEEKIEKRVQAVEHKKSCPLAVDIKVEKLSKTLNIFIFLVEHPLIGIIIFAGIMALCGFGVDKIGEKIGLFK